jgi:hypothetical protein
LGCRFGRCSFIGVVLVGKKWGKKPHRLQSIPTDLDLAAHNFDQRVLTDVLPFAVAERFGRFVAVADPVAAGVVGVVLAGLAVHPKRVVPGGAMDDPAQQVEALLFAAPPRPLASAALADLGLDALELVVGDERFVTPLGFDPFLGLAANQRTLALLDGAEVEPVPAEAAGVDGVLEDRPQGVLRPLASGVPLGIDVARWWRSSRPVEVVGDLLVAGPGEEAVERLSREVE